MPSKWSTSQQFGQVFRIVDNHHRLPLNYVQMLCLYFNVPATIAMGAFYNHSQSKYKQLGNFMQNTRIFCAFGVFCESPYVSLGHLVAMIKRCTWNRALFMYI